MIALEVSRLDLHYGAAQALRGVSLSVMPGTIACVLGRNGTGKSSLLRAIMGIEAKTAGTIALDGRPIDALATHARVKSGLGYVPQGREIFPLLTVEENLRTGLSALPRAERHIPQDVVRMFPVLKTMLARRGGDLSGGQQQQLAIARALVTQPKLLVLDEPTEGIQPSIIKDIGSTIRYLRDKLGMAILLVEQYLDFCRELADRIYIMDRGEVVHDGLAADLENASVRRHLMVS
jgi:urea transport system ATP-binding protein